MANKEINITSPSKGLNTDTHESLLNYQQVYTHALNARLESEDGGFYYLSNESSNILSLKFKEGFVLIGQKVIEGNKIIVFLVNPTTGLSEIGVIDGDASKCENNLSDIDVDCETCGKKYDYPINTGEEPVFSTEPCQTYKTIVSSECLNFNVLHPIHKIDYKVDNQTIKIYWTDNYNHMRWMDINDPPVNEAGILDCNKLKIFPDFTIPCISVIEEQNTGSLKSGTYQFFVAYTNSKGEELSQYYRSTNPASIWENKQTSELIFDTQKSINIEISNLDLTYRYFNIAVAKTIGGVTTFELLGTFDNLNGSFNYTYTGNDKTLRQLTTEDIFFTSPLYVKAETLAVQNNILMFGGMTAAETINYQSIANKIVIYWEDAIIPYNKFEGYHTAENTANYRSYYRDEVYALEFVPILKSGRIGASFHIPGRIPNQSDFDVVSNEDANNFKENPCDTVDTVYKWQIYDTAEVLGYTEEYLNNNQGSCYKGSYRYGTMGYYESERRYPNNSKVWGELAGQKIRHHKMPGVKTSPIFSENPTNDPNFKYSIHPLGIKIDHRNIIEAIEASDLTQEQKDDIIGFEIIRATRTGNNSIIAKGILFNVGEYGRDNETFYYPNYPYNDLRKDPYISNIKPKDHSGANDGGGTNSLVTVTYAQNAYPPNTVLLTGLGYQNNIIVPIQFGSTPQTLEFSVNIIHNPANPSASQPEYWYVATNSINSGYLNYTASTLNIPSAVAGTPIFISIRMQGNDYSGNAYDTYVTFLFIAGGNNSLTPSGLYSTNATGYDYEIKLGGTIHSIKGVTMPDIFNTAVFEGSVYVIKPSVDGDIRLDGFKDSSKRRFSFISPNTTFVRPPLSGYLKIENTVYGKSKGYLTTVLDEPKYSINTSLTVKVAVSLGISTVLILTQNDGMFGSPTMEINLGNFAPSFLQALDMMNKLVPYRQYGYQYVSKGDYTNTSVVPETGYSVRTIELAGYLDPGIQAISGENHPINNFNRESSVYIKVNNNLLFPHEYPSTPVDNSRFNFNSYKNETGIELKDNERVIRNISSLYGSIKRPFIDQYGEIYSYRTVSTGQCFYLDRDNLDKQFPTLFGGDVFINKFAIKRKLPFFLSNTVGFPNNSDVAYDELGNIGYPTYWLSTYPIQSKLSQDTLNQAEAIFTKATKISFGDAILGILSGGGANIAPFVKFARLLGEDILGSLGIKNTNFDRFNEEGVSEIGTFYLFSYGIPYFFVESEVNVDLRQAGNNLDQNFYPNVGTDIPEYWLQEKNVSITKDNFYLYNRDFSKQNIERVYTRLDRDFNPDKKNQDYFSSRVIYSESSNLEERQDNWLIYKVNNYYDFSLTNGKLIDLNPLEQEKVLVRFEDNIAVYNAFVQIATDNKTAIVGTGSMFANPPMEYSNATQGYLGTQHKAFESTKYGYFWVDSKRGEVFQLGTGGQGLSEISKIGNFNWFKENLPFKITKYFPEVNTDNSFNGVGITTVWDNRFERYIITKKDFTPKRNDIIYKDGKFYIEEKKVKSVSVSVTECPPGYNYNSETQTCERLSQIPGTLVTSPIYNIVNGNYGIFGAWIYDSDYNVVNTSESVFWKASVNRLSKWIAQGEGPYDIPVGFSFCLDIPTSKQFYLGITGDNIFDVYIDGTNVFSTSGDPANRDFRAFHIIPIDLTAGSHKISMTVINISGSGIPGQNPGSIAAEIYDNTVSEILNTTSTNDLNILFSTETQTSFPQFDYTCPDGYTLVESVEDCGVFYCKKIETADQLVYTKNFDKEIIELTEVDLKDDRYFNNHSWTISFSPKPEIKSWVSYHSYIPDYYIGNVDYFQSGINQSLIIPESNLWNHNLTNKSYQIFYNKLYPFEVECISKPDIYSKVLQSVNYKLDVLRYENWFDYKIMQNISFDKAEIYNSTQTSGVLNLKLDTSNELYTTNKKVNEDSIDIKLSKVDNTFKFNQFYDITKDANFNRSLYKYDPSNVHKQINPLAIDYSKANDVYLSKRLKGDYFNVRLSNTKQSRYKMIFRWLTEKLIKSIR